MALARDIEQMKTRHRTFLQELVTAQGYTITSGVALEKQQDTENVKKMSEFMRNYAELEQAVKNHSLALDKLAGTVGMATRIDEMELSETFKRLVKETEKSVDKEALKRHPKYREFRQKVWQVHHATQALPEDEDEELVLLNTEDNLTCPLTRRDLVDPMKNTCGHAYSKEAIYEYLRTKRGGGIKCPVAGCNRPITKSNLIFDQELAKKVKRKQKDRKRKAPEEDESEYTQL